MLSDSAEKNAQVLKQKCLDLQSRIRKIELNNEVAAIALARTRAATRRSRVEYAVLLERLEERAIAVPDGIGGSFEEMASPPVPSAIDDATAVMNPKGIKGTQSNRGVKRPKSATPRNVALPPGSGNSASKQKNRDPGQPKRPTNAYLIFCEREKERFKLENLERGGVPGDLTKIMTDAWKNLDENGRKPFYKLYEEDRLRYKQELLTYSLKKGTSPHDTDDFDGENSPKKQRLDFESEMTSEKQAELKREDEDGIALEMDEDTQIEHSVDSEGEHTITDPDQHLDNE